MDKWSKDYASTRDQIMESTGLNLSIKRFGAKLKSYTGKTFYINDRVEPDSIIGLRIAELIGESPKPSFEYIHETRKYIYPALEKEYAELQKTILSMEDFTVTRALELIEKFRTGQ